MRCGSETWPSTASSGDLFGQGPAEQAEQPHLAGGQALGDAEQPTAGDGQARGEQVFEVVGGQRQHGLVDILCCVGPTVLALVGLVSAGTTFAWATDLYDNYAWWFRLGGLAVLAGLAAVRDHAPDLAAGAEPTTPRWQPVAVALGFALL